MTEQPAKPSPRWRRVTQDGEWDAVVDSRNRLICKLVSDNPADDALIIAAPEVAAEHDQLVAMNEKLVTALKILRPMVGAPHDYTIADVWKAQRLADKVLDEAWKL